MTDLKFDVTDYDEFVDRLMVSELPIERAVMAMCEEVGEAAGKIKRLYRGDYKDCLIDEGDIYPKDFIEAVGKELGDVLYYLTAAAHDLGFNLTDIIEANVEKLTMRHKAGTLCGEGDNR